MSETTADQQPIELVAALDEETRLAALATVCRYATGQADALELARMLGLIGRDTAPPPPDPGTAGLIYNTGRCIKCGVATGSRKDREWVGALYGARGKCERCYAEARRTKGKSS